MKDYNRAENKVLKPDAARISADKSAYSPAKSKASGASETGSSAKLGGRESSGNKSRHHRYGGFRGTALSVLLAFLMVLGSVGEAWAAVDIVRTGDETNFATELPLTEVHIIPSKINNPIINILNNKLITVDGTGQDNEKTFYAYNESLTSNSVKTVEGGLISFTFENAAILSDRSLANVVITLSDASFYTGRSNGAQNPTDESQWEHVTLGGIPQIVNIDGKNLHLGVSNGSTTQNWRYGLEMNVNVSVPGAPGDIIFGLTGMTNERASVGTFRNIPNSNMHDYFSESTIITEGTSTQPIYMPDEGYLAARVADGNVLRIAGTGEPAPAPGIKLDESYLTGFITEATADTGMTFQYRAGGGNNKGSSVPINSNLMPPDAAYILDISSSPGGSVWITKSGKLGEELGNGLYSVPRYKTVTVKLKPDSNEYYPKAVYAGDYDADGDQIKTRPLVDPVKVVEDGQTYYYYTFENIMSDQQLHVEWEPIPAKVEATKEWDDNSNANDNRVSLELTLANNTYLPSQTLSDADVKVGDSQKVTWGGGAGYTATDGTNIPADTGQLTSEYDGKTVTWWYNDSTYEWEAHTYNKNKREYEIVASIPSEKVDFLPKYEDNGSLIDYTVNGTVKEAPNPPTGYLLSEQVSPTTVIDGSSDPNPANYAWTLTNKEELAEIEIIKTWDDAEYYKDANYSAKLETNPAGGNGYVRPDLTYTIEAEDEDGTDVTSYISSKTPYTLTGDQLNTNVWKGSIKDLPVYVNGKKVKYKVTEVQPEGFQITSTNPVINLQPRIIREVETETITAKTAVYDAANNTSTVTTTVIVTTTITTYDKSGTPTTNTTSTTTKTTNTETGRVSNSVSSVVVTDREWGEEAEFTNDPIKDDDEFIPISLDIKKTERGSTTGVGLEGAQFGLFNEDFTTPFTDTNAAELVSTETDSDGLLTVNFKKPGTYYIKETKAPKGYELDPDNRWTIVVDSDLTKIELKSGGDVSTLNKIWHWIYNLFFGNSASGTTATIVESTETDSDTGETIKKYTLTATDRVKTASVTATKTWDDKNNQDGKRKQTTLTLQQQIEGETTWTNAKDANGNDRTVNVPTNNNQAKFEVTTFNNLPTYKDGKKIKYRVIEDTTAFDADTYETTYEAADDIYVAQGAGVYILEDDDDTPKDQSIDTKNKYEPLKTKLIVEKIWNDSAYYTDADYTAKKTAQAYERPTVVFDIKAIVDGTDMTENIFTGDLAGKNVLTITGDQLGTNKWSDEITDLPVKWSGGKDVVYQVTERQPAGFTKSDAVNVTPEEKTDTETGDKYHEGKAEITNTPVATEAYTELTLNIKKEDSKTDTEAGLEGAVFSVKKVKDADGQDVTGTTVSTDATAESTGITSFTFKEPGTYEIQETQAPTGYQLNDTVYTVEVKRDDDGLQTITLVSGGDASSGNSVWQWLYNLIFGNTTPSDSIEESGEGTAKTYTLTVKNDPNTADVTVAKTWDDKSDQDGKRTEATLTLQKSSNNGETWEDVIDATSDEVITATVGTDYDDKTKTVVDSFDNLPAYEDGKRLKYRVDETGQDAEYTVTYDAADNEYSDENNGAYISRTNGTGIERTLGVYNKYEPKTTSLEITKKWADGEYYNNAATFDAKKSAGYNRPAVTYTITAKDADDADVTSMIPAGKETLTLNGDQTGTDEWKGTIEGLPLYANGGKLITYTVTETQPTGYRMDGNGSAAYDSTTNKHTKTITNTPVKKDEYNSVILTVKKTDKNTDGPLNGAEFKLFTDNTYETPLDLTPEDAPSISGVSGSDGKLTVTFRKPGTYYLKETKAPRGYELDENNKFVIVVDKDLANISLVEDASAGSESGGSVWKWLWNLIFGDDTSTDIVDSVDPQTGATVHTMTVEDDPIKANLEIKKNWDDAQNQDGKRAGSTVKLQKKVGDGGWVDVSGKTGTVATGGDSDPQPIDVVKWEDLPAYEDGKLILYRVVENAIPEYSTTYSDEGNGVDLVEDSEAETPIAENDTITVTNTHTPEVGYIKVNKIWIDHNNQDGKRPETIDFKIEDNNAATDDWTYTMTPDAAARDNRPAGSYTWMDGSELLAFPVYKSGQKINYTLSETAITGYTTEYEHDGTSAAAAPSFQLTANQTSEVTVTNTHEPEEVSLTFTKTWTDENNKWGNRPSLNDYRKQMLILTADQPVIIPSDPTTSEGNNDVGTASDTYVYTWSGLQKYKSKSNPTDETTLINYTIREVLGLMDGYASPGYPDTGVSGSGKSTEVDGNIPLAITNELQLTSLTVNKVWDDADDQDGLRSDVGAEMVLYMTPEDGEKVKYDTSGSPQAVATDDGWTYTWTNLPVYSERKRVTYSVEETKSGSTKDEYTTTYAGNDRTARAGESAGTVTVTNKHVPETVDITITKTWNDSDYLNANARINGYKRPENITVNITAKIPADEPTNPYVDVTDDALTDEQKTVTMTGSATGATWTYKVEDLPKYHNGKQIEYTMSEEEPTRFEKEDGSLSFEENEGTGTVTNTPKKDDDELKDTSITIKKTDANGGGVLEGGVFTITKKGETPDDDTPEEITTGEDGTVTYTFTTDGTYTIEEKTAPTGYEKIDDTFTVTVTKELTEIKVSDDNENFWHWIYSLLKRITHGEDTNVEAVYDAETNTITYPNPPKRASLKVTKVWDDNNNQDGVRPGNVGISITGTVPAAEQGADPVPVASVAKDISLNTNNADTTADKTGSTWSNTYDNLPIYYNGQQITYKIVEDLDNINTYVTHGDNYAESYITQTSVLNEDDAVELKVKNTRTPEKTKLTINKVWDDDKYETGDPADIGNKNAYTRPDDLEFDITATANNDSVDLPAGKARATLTEDDEDDEDSHKWSTTVTELPVYDGGYPITYAVSEVIPTDYTCEVTEAIAKDAETGEWSITVKNTPKEEDVLTPTTIKIKKTDAKTNTGTGLSGGVFTITSPTGVTANVTTDANGEATYDLNATGDWTVKETTAPTGYVVNAETYTFNVDRELTEIKQKSDKSIWQWLYDLFVKAFSKNPATGSSSWDGENNTLTVPNEPDTTSLTVDKKWVDGNNQDGIRVNTLPFTLKEVDAEGNQIDVDTDTYTTVTPDQNMTGIDTTMPDNRVSGTVAWTGVPMYRDGKLIKYAVVEDTTTISEYTASYSDDTSDPKDNVGDGITLVKNPGANDNKITVTNTYTPKTIDIQVKKVWDDSFANAEERATALADLKADIYLYERIEGNERRLNDKTQTGVVTSSVEDNEVVYTFEDLPVNSDGKVITYRIEEGALSGYESSYSTTYTKKDDTTYGPDEDAKVVAGDVKLVDGADATVTITNTERLQIEATKEWVDGAIANTEFQLWRTTTRPLDTDYRTGTKTTNPGTAAEKTEETRTWSPGDGWEQVASHIFLVNDFTSASTKTYKFPYQPKYDKDGNLYYYRVFEPTDEDDLFAAYQVDDTTVKNTNMYSSSGVVELNVVKEIEGRAWLDDTFTGANKNKDENRFWFEIEPIKSIDEVNKTYEDFDENDPDDREAKAAVPMPANATAAADLNHKVGAIGREVTFDPIIITSANTQGGTTEYYYKVYEVADSNGQSLDNFTNHTGKKDGIEYEADPTSTDSEFVPTVHILKIVASDDGTGNITAKPYWDYAEGATPVITNKYDAVGDTTAYLVKRIDGRDYKSGDEFKFEVMNVAGSVVRANPDDAGSTQANQAKTMATISDSKGSYVSDGPNYLVKNVSNGDIKALKADIQNFYKLSDLTVESDDNIARGTFIYEIVENNDKAAEDPSSAAGNDLKFDDRRVYLKVDVEDNFDGTLKTKTSYWRDAACTKPMDAKVLVNDADGSLAPANVQPGAPGYTLTNAAFFENEKFSEIVVKKTWVDSDGNVVEPTDNAVIRLNRYKVEDLDRPGDLPTNIDLWENVQTHTFDRGDYYTAVIGSKTYTQTEAARAVAAGEITEEAFNGATWTFNENPATYTFTNLPLHMTDANGKDWWYIYRVREATDSDAFEASYSTDGGVTWHDSWTDTGNMRDRVLVIKNTLKASNTANIAAVKQLMGRDWLDTMPDNSSKDADRYNFQLVPVGIGTYDKDGKLIVGDLENIPDGYKYDDSHTVKRISDDNLKQDTAGVIAPNMPAEAATTGIDEDKAQANINTDTVGVGERLARFGSITYDMSDLIYDPGEGHMQGDFFYLMKEIIPDDALMLGNDGKTTSTKYSEVKGTDAAVGKKFKLDGVTYDGTVHTVHVKVRENRTEKLTVQVAYDEKTVGDVSTGTQFTPVYTNYYDAEGLQDAKVNKYIMGRDWADNDSFVFDASPLGGAPFADEDGNPKNDDDKLTITKDDLVSGKTYLEELLPKLHFALSDLPYTVGENGTKDARDIGIETGVTYNDGTPVKEGMKYGRFVYSLREESSVNDDLNIDKDTEYIRITVIDKGDGTLDTSYKVYEDRYCTRLRKDSEDPNKDATAATFVNQLKRDLTVTKTWTSTASDTVTLKLQWSFTGNDNDWNDADGTSWLAGIETVMTITQAEYNSGTVSRTFSGLPAYANVPENISNLDDKWVYYRVVENPIAHVDTRYSTDAYEDGDEEDDDKYSADPISTEAEKKNNNWNSPRITQTYVVNFPEDLEGEASVNVVKQFTGRSWTDETFTFEIIPVSNTVELPLDKMPLPYNKTTQQTTKEATVSTNDTRVSTDEHRVSFDPIIIKLSQLKLDPSDNVAKGEFVYKIKEKKPDGAREYTVGTGDDAKTYWIKDSIKYTAEEHTVKIVAINDGSGEINTTVSYDGRQSGDFVPVYTNEALLPTPVSGTKTWIGGTSGEDGDHNNESLNIVLERKLRSETAWTPITEDEIGRTIEISWDHDKDDSDFSFKVRNDEDELVNPVLDLADENGGAYEYRVRETVPNGYDVKYETTENTHSALRDNAITNTSNITDSLSVTKTWDDEQDAAGMRPEDGKVIVHLYRIVTTGEGQSAVSTLEQVDVEPKEIDKTNTTATWEDLPVYGEDGEKIKYVVLEESVAGYTTTYLVPGKTEYKAAGDAPHSDVQFMLDGDADADAQNVDVKNSLSPATDKVEVTKHWDDNNNCDGQRPKDVTFKLYKYVWKDATETTAAGYGDKELVSGTGDDSSGRPAVQADVGPGKADKVGDTIKFDHLVLDGKKDDVNTTGYEIDPVDENTWKGEWINLPLTENGKTIIYVIEEDTNGDNKYADPGTEGKYSNKPCISGDQFAGYNVKNTYTPVTITFEGDKVWEDDGRTHDNTTELKGKFILHRDWTVTDDSVETKHTEVVSDYHIDWDGNKFTIIDIPKYHESGAEYTYWLQEVQIDGYKMPVYSEGGKGYSLNFNDADDVYKTDDDIIWIRDGVVVTGDDRDDSTAQGIKTKGTITNTLETGMIFVEKWWDDQNDADGVRKNTQTKVSLWKKVWNPEQDKYDDEKIEKVNGTIGAQGGATSGDDSMKRDVPTGYQGSETAPTKNVVDVVETGNSYAWNNLPVYETVTYKDGGVTKTKIVKIPYVVIEDDIDGYVTTYTCSETDIGDPTADTVTYFPLYKAPDLSAVVNQTGYQSATLDEETTSIGDNTAGDLVDVTANTAYFAIKNQRTPKVGEVVVEKEWEDTVDGVDYSDTYRPATLTATLTATTASGKAANIFTADGSINRREGTKNTKTITLTKTSDWAKQTVSGLPDTYEGEAITYTVTEDVPGAYKLKATTKTAKYSHNAGTQDDPYKYDSDDAADATDATSTQLTYKFTNELETVKLVARKVWVDGDPDVISDELMTGSTRKYRPESITLQAKDGDTVVHHKTVDKDEAVATQHVEFTVPKYSATEVATKTITYSEATDAQKNDSFIIWTDADDPSKTYHGGAEENIPATATATIPTGEPAEIEWAVDEAKVPANYEKTITKVVEIGGVKVGIITNRLKAAEFTGTKVWLDDGRTHRNPEELNDKLTLHRDWTEDGDLETETVGKLSDDKIHVDWNGNTFTIIGLPGYTDNGEEYTYWVSESKIDDYEDPAYGDDTKQHKTTDQESGETVDGILDGGAITNRQLIDIKVSKIWNDESNAKGERTATTVKLEQLDGEDWNTAEYYDAVNEEWKAVEDGDVSTDEDEFVVIEWNNVAAVDKNGRVIKYRIIEDKVDGYITTYTGDPKTISGEGNVVEFNASDLASTGGKASITFKNTYGAVISSPTDEDVDLFKSYKEKNDEGDVINLEGKEFEYELKGNAKGTDGSTQDATNLTAEGANEAQTAGEDTAPIKIDPIGFNKLGTYSFTLTEKVPDPKTPGVTFDETSYNLLATVKADTENNDEWIVEWKIVSKKVGDTVTQITEDTDAHKATFKNYYDDLKKEVVPEVTKELSGHNIGGNYKFEFVLFGGPDDKPVSGLDENEKLEGVTSGTAMDSTTKKATEVVPLNKDGGKLSFTLDDLKKLDGSYEASRTFTYLVYEKGGNAKGVVYDTAPKELKVILTYVAAGTEQDDASTTDVDESKEHLKVTYDPAGSGTAGAANTGIKFKNEYNPDATQSSVTDDYTVRKEIEDLNNKGRTPKDEEFTFRLKGQVKGTEEDAQDATHIDMLAVNDADGNVVFPKVAFTKPGTYTFKMTELNPYDSTINPYDRWVRTAKAKVTDEGDGTMKVVWTVTAETGAPKAVDQAGKLVTFVNKTVPETVDKPVRVSWVNDTDADDTVGTDRDGNEINVVTERPTEVTVTLQAKKTVYTYDGKDYTTFDALMAAMPEGTSEDDARDAIENGTEIDGKKITPSEKWVDVTKKADGTDVDSSITLDKNDNLDGDPNNWGDVDTWKGLPKYDENGAEIDYRIIQSGYKLTDDTVVSPKKAGDSGETGIDNEPVAGGSTLPAEAIPGYGSTPVSIPGTDLTTFVNLYKTTIITGTKTWVDADPDAHNNSSEVKLIVKRTADQNPTDETWADPDKTKTLVEDRDYHVDWSDDSGSKDKKFTIKGLTKYVDAKATNPVEYKYQVTEVAVDGYTTTYKDSNGDDADALYATDGKIINTAGKMTVEATKIWKDDSENPSGRTNIEFQLHREINGAKKELTDEDMPKDTEGNAQTAVMTVATGGDHDQNMTAKWENLPIKSGSYDVIYTVEEVDVPPGYVLDKIEYQSKTAGNWTTNKPADWNGNIRFTNKLDAETIDVPVRKVWVDNDNQDGERPVGIMVRIYIDKDDNGKYDDGEQVKLKDGKLDDTGTVVADLELNDSNNWKRIFKKLPKTDSNGKAVTYKVGEVVGRDVIDGTTGNNTMDGIKTDDKYTVSITGDQTSGYVITNSTVTELVTVRAYKKWKDDDDVKSTTRKDVTLYLIGRTDESKDAAVAYDGGSRKIKVNKTADDEGEIAGMAEWEDLPKYINGTELIWEVYEASIPGYKTDVEQTGTGFDGKTDEDGLAEFDVTNTYVGPVKKVEAEKVWDDDSNRDGLRGDIKLVLYRQIGDDPKTKEEVGEKTISKTATGEALKVKWENLPEMTVGGTETTTETRPKYVEANPEGDDPNAEGLYEEDGDGGHKLTEDTQVDPNKTYYKQDGTEDVEVETTTETRAIVYWVEEENVPQGYTSVVTQTAPGKFEAKNIHVPETTKVYVTKLWNDKKDEEGIRPDHLTFKLKGDDESEYEYTIMSKDDGWNVGSEVGDETTSHVFTNLPKYKEGEVGEEIEYTVVELDSDDKTELDGTHDHNKTSYHYTVSAIPDGKGTKDEPYGFINSYYPAHDVSLTVHKKWVGDEEVKEKTRGDNKLDLTLIEVIDGAEKKKDTQTVELPDKEGDSYENIYTWDNLPLTDRHIAVDYKVEEKPIKGYVTTYSNVEHIKVKNPSGNPSEQGWYEFKDDEYVPTEDTEVAVGKTYYLKDYEVTITNEYKKVVPAEDVIYVDPLNEEGDMIRKTLRYGDPTAAEDEADNKKKAPDDPSHAGYTFIGWAKNYSGVDEFIGIDDEDDEKRVGGNYVMVAMYSAIPVKPDPIVSYVDPQSGKIVTGKVGEVVQPANPKAKNMQFVKWVKTTDAAGNTIYVAQYECDCANGGKSVDKSNVDTGDDAMLTVWMLLFVMAMSFMILTMMIRSRGINVVRDNYRPKH